MIYYLLKKYLYLNNLTDVPKCPYCGKYVNFKGTLKKGYNKYCSISCLNKSEEHKNKLILFNLNEYGCESHNQADVIKTKKKESCIIKFGVDSPMKSEEIKEKFLNTMMTTYGVSNPMNIDYVIDNRKILIESGNEFNIKRMLNRITDDIVYIRHEYNGNAYFHCNKCDKDFEIRSNLLMSRIAEKIRICTNCNKLSSFSEIERTLAEYLISLNIDVERKNRTILNGKEIDIYIPSDNLGIEINGLFWHSNKFKANNYHLMKTKLCNSKGIDLIHIFEDEWLYKQEIIKSIIKFKLGIFDNIIFSDDCIIKDIDDITSNNFLNINDLQGSVKGNVSIGLYKNNDLLLVMIFNKTSNNDYKLLRLSFKQNSYVIDGSLKILNYFIDKYLPVMKNIIKCNHILLYENEFHTSLNYFINSNCPNQTTFDVNQLINICLRQLHASTCLILRYLRFQITTTISMN